MSDYKGYDENRIKHLEMIQAVITRLAGNSFLLKGWALTLTGGFLGFGVTRDDAGLAVAAVLPILIFWTLDAYYLRAERLFRELHDRVRREERNIEPFFMGATAPAFVSGVTDEVSSWRRTLRRATLAGFYGALVAAAALVALIICAG